jgi:hypothetical protein
MSILERHLIKCTVAGIEVARIIEVAAMVLPTMP